MDESLLKDLAAYLADMAQEYEQRQAAYQSALDSVEEMLSTLEGDPSLAPDKPEALMSDLLMQQEELENIIGSDFNPDVLKNKEIMENLPSLMQRVQDMNDSITDSMTDPLYNGAREGYLLCRDVLRTALTEVDADYMKLIYTLQRLDPYLEAPGEE